MATKRKKKPTKKAKRIKGKTRSAKTGRYVTHRQAAKHPDTTVAEQD